MKTIFSILVETDCERRNVQAGVFSDDELIYEIRCAIEEAKLVFPDSKIQRIEITAAQ